MKTRYMLFFALINIKKGIVRIICTLLLMILLLSTLMSFWIIADNKILNDKKVVEKKYYQDGLYIDLPNVEEINNTIEILKEEKFSFNIDTFSKEYDFFVGADYKVGITIKSYDEFDKILIEQVDGNGQDSIYISSALLETLKSINYNIGDTIRCELLDAIDHNSLFVNHKIVGVFESQSIEAFIDVRYLIKKDIITQAKIIINEADTASYSNIKEQYDNLAKHVDKDCINLNKSIKNYNLQKIITIVVCLILSFLFIFATFSVITTSILLTSYEKTGMYRILKLHGLKNITLYIINLIEFFIISLAAILISTLTCRLSLNLILQMSNNILEMQATSIKFNYFIPLIVFALIEIYTVFISLYYVKKYSSKLGITVGGGENE